MKLKIHKKSKRVMLLILVLLIVLSGIQLCLPMAKPQTVKTETVVYESTCEPKVGYQVFINPNEVYPGSTQQEGEYYSKKLLNHIQADFDINYNGSQPAPLEIEYQIMATVNGFQGEDAEKTNFWSKSFPLTAKKVIKEKNTDVWSTKEKVSFQLSPYDAFAIRAKEITGMDVGNELVVSLKGKVIAHTDKEDLETSFDSNIQIPLMEDVFQITKSGADPVVNAVSTTIEMPKSLNLFTTALYGSLLTLCLVGIIILMFFSREPNPEEELLKKANTIVKNYGSRIVALQNIPKMNYRQHYKVHSMKDMVKIADELQKPIFYEVDKETIVKDYEFHIIEEDTIYSLFLDTAEA